MVSAVEALGVEAFGVQVVGSAVDSADLMRSGVDGHGSWPLESREIESGAPARRAISLAGGTPKTPIALAMSHYM